MSMLQEEKLGAKLTRFERLLCVQRMSMHVQITYTDICCAHIYDK